jgi:hypothetical protein
VPLPVDVVVPRNSPKAPKLPSRLIADVAADDMILDIGPQTAANFAELLKSSQTILWNGPVGVFEFDQFGNGTKVLAKAIADSAAFSIAGGGDTLAAIDKYGVGADLLHFYRWRRVPRIRRRQSAASRGDSGRAGQGLSTKAPGKGSDLMVKQLPVMIVALLLAPAPATKARTAPSQPQGRLLSGRVAGRDGAGDQQAPGPGRPGKVRRRAPAQGARLPVGAPGTGLVVVLEGLHGGAVTRTG